MLSRPEALATTTNGSLLIANDGTNQILRRDADGVLTVVAGTGHPGYSGDDGPAVDAELDDPGGMAVAADGTIYIADSGNNRVRTISPDGTIATVAGNGRYGRAGVGGLARRAQVGDPQAVAIGADGRIVIADSAGIQAVAASGLLSTIISAGPGAMKVDHIPTAIFPDAVAVTATGDLYVADFSPKPLIELSPTLRVVDDWDVYVQPAGLATTANGATIVAIMPLPTASTAELPDRR